MKFQSWVLVLMGWVWLSPVVVVGQENMAERQLRQMVEEEQRILRAAERPDGTHDTEILERRFQRLIHRYDGFIQANPDFAVGYVAYARLLERVGEDRAARALYMQANRLDPNIPLVKNQLGNFLVEEERFAEALPYYLAATELEPGEPVYHYQLGELLHEFRDGFLDENIFTRTVLDKTMLEAFGRAASLAPGEPAFAYRFAEAFYDLEEPRWDQALEAWDRVERQATSAVERETVTLHRANIAIKRGRIEEAETLLAKVNQPVLAANKAALEKQLTALKSKESPSKENADEE